MEIFMFDEIFVNSINVNTIIKIVIILLIFLIFKNIIVKFIINFAKKLSDKWNKSIISLSIDSTEKHLKRIIIITGIYCALLVIPFNAAIVSLIIKAYRILMVLILTGGLLNLLDTYNHIVINNNNDLFEKKPVLKTLFPLIIKGLKFLLILIAVVIIAVDLGFEELKSLLAGVGIGGVAVALAAQDLLKNIFGGFVILTDRTFNTGDFIKIDSNEGSVEEVGIRSTKVRTIEQELIVVPNSKFAEGSVINYSKRGNRRVRQVIGATYSTSSTKLKAVIDKITDMLKKNDRVLADSVNVKFDGFGNSSLEILVVYLVNTPEYGIYMQIKEEVNFNIISIFEEEKVEFALPSLSVYMKNNTNK